MDYLQDYLDGLQKATNIEEYDNAWKEQYKQKPEALWAVPLASAGHYDVKYSPTPNPNALPADDPRVAALKNRQKEWQAQQQQGTLKTLDKSDPRFKGIDTRTKQNTYNSYIKNLNVDYDTGKPIPWSKKAWDTWYGGSQQNNTPATTPQQQTAQQQPGKFIKGYNANGSTTYFDDELKEQFKGIRNNTYSPNQYWQSGMGVDNDLYSALYNAELPENSSLYNSIDRWNDNDWKEAERLFMNSPQIRQDRLDRMKKYWDGISDVTPVYKKGGSLKQDYRAWEKEMYDSYKCGGKTKKKCCGGTMSGKKKACGGMKVKK